MKKFVVGVLCVILLFACSFETMAATMYSTDGRSIKVDDSEIKAYEKVGWYWGKPTEIYAFYTHISYKTNGIRWRHPETNKESLLKTATIGEKRVAEYEAVGWYWGWPTAIYNSSGKMVIIGAKRVPEYEAVGWYWGKPTTMYNKNNETIIVGEERIEEYTAKGWDTEKFCKMYSLDGRTVMVNADETYDYESVGWYWGKPVKVYSLKGESRYMGTNRLSSQLSNKYWYPFKPVKLYDGNGKSIVVDKNDVQSWINVGWSTEETSSDKKDYGSDYKDCSFCSGGKARCNTCGGDGSVRGYSSAARAWVDERCPAVDCVGGKAKCNFCGGHGKVRK